MSATAIVIGIAIMITPRPNMVAEIEVIVNMGRRSITPAVKTQDILKLVVRITVARVHHAHIDHPTAIERWIALRAEAIDAKVLDEDTVRPSPDMADPPDRQADLISIAALAMHLLP
jgi:hypothetical protein